ncbi:flagellar assembly protein FliW [Desulfovirgula thermocuniculi]|uniref:flagellar assembly protein FliW n=1 Tax=Desulfovirgula thermocuniculi TaxID=348842 RepID=UPI0003FAFB47|nr:flagellar assembly protein FliW [Desulfovirgula thermocuniculi]
MRDGRTILNFPAGIPGLPPELKEFELLALAPDSPFFFLQSLQDENTGFILINPFFFFPTYEFELPGEETAALGISSPEQVAVFCIVNASRGLKNATVNLLAPVVVNVAAGTARQVVLVDRRYGLRHPLPQTPPKMAKSPSPEREAAKQNEAGGEGE